jgi:hypothetical protein
MWDMTTLVIAGGQGIWILAVLKAAGGIMQYPAV